ncbi:MAG: hypothetical protein Q9183_005213, partial [Haloplaca sp. 2 TL-2023]
KPLSLDVPELLSSFRDARARLFLFDWDGTLTPIVQDPAAAVPTLALRAVLERVSSDPANDFWIISGRDAKFLDCHLGSIRSIGLSAEHGAFIRHPRCTDWENIAGPSDLAWQDAIMTVFDNFTARTPGSWIERKTIAITWHYRNAAPVEGALNAKECRALLEEKVALSFPRLGVMNGKMCLEVRPKRVNKGAIAQKILDCESKDVNCVPPEWLLCVGDDVTDEGER